MSSLLNRFFINNVKSTIAATIDEWATSLTVQSGTGALFAVPAGKHIRATLAQGENIEVISIIDRSGDTLTIQRAQEGTAAQSFTAGAKIEIRLTAETLNQFVVLLNALNPVAPGSVWVDDVWTHSLGNFFDPPQANHAFSILSTEPEHGSYVFDAFNLYPGDWVEVRLSLQMNATNGSVFFRFYTGVSWTDRYTLTETQDGSEWVYRYTVTNDDVNASDPFLRLANVIAGAHGTSGNLKYYDLLDIQTSKGNLQPGDLRAPQTMTVPKPV